MPANLKNSAAAAAAKSLQSCPTLCDPIDGGPPGSPVPGILQARTLEWENSAVAWKWSVFISILKKGNAKKCSNHLTIALISHTSKVMLKILQARLQQYVNYELPNVQAGFRKYTETRDLQEMRIPDHLTCLLRNLYAGKEATVRTGHGTWTWTGSK